MAATIQSAIAGKPTENGISREDLAAGDVVTLTASDLSHSTYAWTLTYAPEDVDQTASAAVLSSTTGVGPITFTVDNEGTYLIRLVVDQGNVLTEDVQFVALRFLTVFGSLRLVGAGERRDSTGVIPVDASATGWADNQNYNLLRINSFLKRVSTSGRTFTVDANRGTDISNTPNDSFVGYADYSTISAAITAANALVPAPSATDPVVVKVFPGYYEEDITFSPFVHVVAAYSLNGKELDRSTIVKTTSGGTIVQTAAITGVSDFCYVRGILFENTETTANPVFTKTGAGLLLLDDCAIIQNSNDAGNGPCYTHAGGSFVARNCEIVNNATIAVDRLSVFNDTTGTSTTFEDCYIKGPSAVDLNPSDLAAITARFDNCQIVSTFANAAAFAIRSNADTLTITNCEISQDATSTQSVTVHPGAGVHGTGITTTIRWSLLSGGISFDTTGIVGNTILNLGASDYGTLNITGSLTEQNATVEGTSLFYDNTTTSVAAENVQDAIDHSLTILTQTGLGGAAVSLDTAYDGVSNPLTPTFGAGSGRRILADSGAVVIQAANPPAATPVVGQSDGQLQVEGNVQVGAIGNPEIDLDPNPYGIGPLVSGGALIYPDIDTAHRAIPAFVLGAKSTNSPLFHTYNLLLQTATDTDASRDEIGRVMLKAGDQIGTGATGVHAGQIFLQAGEAFDTNGGAGEVWIIPGQNTTAADIGRLQIANIAAATQPTLAAFNAFVGGVAGDISFYVSGVGVVTASILAGDNLATVQTKLAALAGIASAVGDPIVLTAQSRGVNSEIYFIQDDQGGALNTALGDFSIGAGAVFTPGTFPEVAGLACTGANQLTVYDDLVVTGTISGTVISTPASFQYNRVTVNNAASPYAVLDDDHYIGVLSSTGVVTINLPTTVSGATDGREIVIKDEDGNANTNNITISAGAGQIEGSASVILTNDYASITLVCNGQTGAATRWYII